MDQPIKLHQFSNRSRYSFICTKIRKWQYSQAKDLEPKNPNNKLIILYYNYYRYLKVEG